MNVDLRTGDSLEILKELKENSIDSVVTDPPYGLSFMGKKWDYDVPTTELWKEVIRVLKPGGHLLSFSSSRTYHRMAVAVEDAGFEIRDQIMYVYGSGFPKSHNIEKAIIKKYAKAKQSTEHRMRQVWNSHLQETKPTIEEQGQILFSFLQKQGCMQREATNWMEAFRYWEEQPKLEGRSYDEETKRQLQRHKVCPLSEGILADVPTGWLYPRAQISDGDVVKENVNEDGSSTSRGPQSTQQLYSQLDAICDEWGTQALGMEQSLQSYKGFGTALKPAHEPICLARKPFKGTVVDNVIKHGTGGLNIDKSRVEYKNETPGIWGNKTSRGEHTMFEGLNEASPLQQNVVSDAAGRFPANFIHDGSDEVVEQFPDTKSGASKPAGEGCKEQKNSMFGLGGKVETPREASQGSAARFFYCAKVSKKERNAGLNVNLPDVPKLSKEEQMERYGLKTDNYVQLINLEQQIEAGVKKEDLNVFAEYGSWFEEKIPEGRDAGQDAMNGPHKQRPVAQANTHPTVKPVKLMTYLVNLITPIGGTVLDPFMGSGSTGMACKQEGFDFIGIDLNQEYMQIAKARIDGWK